jgi:lysophospholipase L1-like esterase
MHESHVHAVKTKISKSLAPKLFAALAVVVALVLSPAFISSASAATAATQTLNIALIGDSYTAGNGAGSYESGAEGTSYRSTINWGRNYAAWLNAQGVHTTVTNLAYSGSTTADVLNSQIAQIPTGTNLVMLTIGGNDVNFGDIVQQCFVIAIRDPAGCRDDINAATAGIPTLMSNTQQIFSQLQSKLGANAKVVLVGYPLLSNTDDYTLTQCEDGFLGIICSTPDSYNAGTAVRNLGKQATTQQQSLVNQWNASHSLKVTYISGVANAFAGHEPDPSVTNKNNYRWMNEFLETEGHLASDGTTTSSMTTDTNCWYHPNVIGHQQIAAEIEREYGVSPAVQSLTLSQPLGNSLIAPFSANVSKPFAWLQGPLAGYVGESIGFDARGSYFVGGTIDKYEWDFDGDGVYDLTTSDGVVNHVFTAPVSGSAHVRVTASNGQTAVASALLSVTVEPAPQTAPAQPTLKDKPGVFEGTVEQPLPQGVIVKK